MDKGNKNQLPNDVLLLDSLLNRLIVWYEPYEARVSRTVLWEAWAEMPLPTRLCDAGLNE